MTDIFDVPSGELPDDLAMLDRELSAIRYEERASFVPELRAELARAWRDEPARRRSARRRHLTAAALVALLLGGAAVPQARASFARFIDVFAPTPMEAPRIDVSPVPVMPPGAAAEPVLMDALPTVTPPELPSSEVVVAETRGETPTGVRMPPRILDRTSAEAMLRDAYPAALQLDGIGGEVRLRMQIDGSGRVTTASVRSSSGIEELDRVVMELAPRLRFVPALEDGRAVATWIEFPVLFEPDPVPVRRRDLEPVADPLTLPTVDRSEWWHLSEPHDPDRLPDGADSEAELEAELASAHASVVAAM
ncbi:MAG: TonB family protein, partial [Gemmatimonadota bacterium]|nr:TonB family protein [Gemmatimonadota bacterium]